MSDDASAEQIRTRVVYAGRVQGVGFRYTALELSRDFAVAGYVRNLPDGVVELEAQGAADQVDAFLKSVTQHFAGHVRDEQRCDAPRIPSEIAFQIRV